MNLRLDKIDIRILSTLSEEGRIQNQQLAEKVCLSAGACSHRFRQLDKARYIVGYSAEIDMRRVCNAISIHTIFRLSEQGSLKQAQFLKALDEIPEVVDCYEIAGDSDFIVRFDCSSLEIYHDRVNSLISDPGVGVQKVESHVILRHIRKLKRSNLLYLAQAASMI